MQSTAPVSVVIVSFNTCELTRKALTALFASSRRPSEVVVVDNASSDGSVEMIRLEFPLVKLIVSKENLGFAKANNLALRQYVTQDYVWLLNSDTEVGVNSLADCLSYLENNPEVAGVEPQLIYPGGAWQSVGGYFPGITNVPTYLLPLGYFLPISIKKNLKSIALYPQEITEQGIELDYITGAAAFFRKTVLDNVGLLGEEYFMYFEETDLCYRIKKAGFKLMAIKTDPVVHVYGGSFKRKHDPKRLKIFLASLEIFVRKNYVGFKRNIILLEIALLGKLSVWVKSFKNF